MAFVELTAPTGRVIFDAPAVKVAIRKGGSMRQQGFVKSYNRVARFGFIESTKGEEFFVHHTGLSGLCCLEQGMEVEFETREPGRATEVVELPVKIARAARA
jgi:cold shock CspA family protein